MNRITIADVKELVRVVNVRLRGASTEQLDNATREERKTWKWYHLRGLALYRFLESGEDCILEAKTRRELYIKISGFLDGVEESQRDNNCFYTSGKKDGAI